MAIITRAAELSTECLGARIRSRDGLPANDPSRDHTGGAPAEAAPQRFCRLPSQSSTTVVAPTWVSPSILFSRNFWPSGEGW